MSAALDAPRLTTRPAVLVAQAKANTALQAAARDVTALLRALPNGNVPIPNCDWTVAETAVHLCAGTRLYLDCARGESSPVTDLGALPAMNAQLFRDFTERDPATLADLIDEAVAAYVDTTNQARGDEPIAWHLGHVLPLSMLTCILVGEYLVHGYDVARATGRPWTITPAQARYAIAGLSAAMPLAVDPEGARGVDAAYEIRVRGGPRFVCRFRDGALRVERPGPGRVDCRFSVEPVPYLLVSYGRRSQWLDILRGQMRAWGRKPWLAMCFKRLLRQV
ncbi:MAG TPA: maleylpyruvate isomerase family mycothiol-dependent enzyme [Chloroflexota bacterium]|jgi:uncharacterized protein (TIGR03083 family)